MKTKLIYISNTRLPSEKANSYQTMQMCNSFSKVYDGVELWTGKSNNTKELKLIKNVYGFYNIQETFKIRKFFQFDSKILFDVINLLTLSESNKIRSSNLFNFLSFFITSKILFLAIDNLDVLNLIFFVFKHNNLHL